MQGPSDDKLSPPLFFTTPTEFRRWLRDNHDGVEELWVGFYRKDSGEPSITWPQSVDEALCYGWIDGLRKKIDERSYKIRFTPRRTTSVWSAVNIKRVEVLTREGRMQSAGRAAFSARKENRSGIYAYEQRPTDLPPEYQTAFRQNKRAWEFYHAQPAGYRKLTTWRIVSAKKEETRQVRLQQLIKASTEGRRL